jgi:hypothetical protein
VPDLQREEIHVQEVLSALNKLYGKVLSLPSSFSHDIVLLDLIIVSLQRIQSRLEVCWRGQSLCYDNRITGAVRAVGSGEIGGKGQLDHSVPCNELWSSFSYFLSDRDCWFPYSIDGDAGRC